jgi:Zn-dependent peptidase ImmA (M78 family)
VHFSFKYACSKILHNKKVVKTMMTVNVLGTKYTIKFSNKVKDKDLEGLSGYCDFYTKTIIIDETQKDETFVKSTIRHELIHAFLYESGLDVCSWGRNEEIVDWIANQFPKIQNAFVQCDAV